MISGERVIGEIIAHDLEDYIRSLARPAPPGFSRIADEGARLNFPIIDDRVGTLLSVLIRATGARRVLEIGTANGYSGSWIAHALPPDGLLTTIEIDQSRADLAKRNFAALDLTPRVQQLVGDAVDLVPQLSAPFNLIFNDGDKMRQSDLHDRLVNLLRTGGLLVTDNALWSGEVVPGFTGTPLRPRDEARAIAAYNQKVAQDWRLLTSIVPLRDGVAISVKL